MNGWAFPYARKVRALVDAIGRACLEESLEPNAPLGAGANAIAVPEEEMKHLLSSEDDLSLVLKHAIANGAINVQREYRSEEHTSELQSLMRISYAVFCLKKK